MAITTLDNGWVSDSFEMGEHPFRFGSAIVLPEDQYFLLSSAEVEAMKAERYAAWYAVVTASPDPNEIVVELTPEELAALEEGDV